MSRLFAKIVSVLWNCALVLSAASIAAAQAIPFQGLLTDNVGTPLDGTYDLQFTLYDAVSGGSPVGSAINIGDIVIAGGIVNTELNFGDAFWSADRWLEVGVRDGASVGSYEPISPRTPILWSPRATSAKRLGPLVNEVSGSIENRSSYDMRFYLDDDDNQPNEWFSVYDGDDAVLLRLVELAYLGADNAVQLPGSSIGPAETSAEAGLANEFATSNTAITNQVTLASATITLPVAGYVIAIATFQLYMEQGTGSQFAIAENSTTFPSEYTTASSPTGTTDVPSSYIRVFNTTAGAKTYNFLGYEAGGTLKVYYPRLLLLFVPTGYGTVETSSPGPIDPEFSAGLTEADIDASRLASIEANQQRIERELAEIRQQMNAVPSEKAVVENRP